MSAGQLFKIAPCTQEPPSVSSHFRVITTAFVVVLLQLLFLLLICVHSCGVRSRDHLVPLPCPSLSLELSLESVVVFLPGKETGQRRAGLPGAQVFFESLGTEDRECFPGRHSPEPEAGVEQMAPAEMVVGFPPSQEHVLLLQWSPA